MNQAERTPRRRSTRGRTTPQRVLSSLLLILILPHLGGAALADDIADELEALLAVEAEGAGHARAKEAWDRIASDAGADDLPRLLDGLGAANPVAANWLRTAIERVATRAATRSELPSSALEAYVRDTARPDRGRELAYEWAVRLDDGARERLVPTFLEDSNVTLRRLAVERLIERAGSTEDADLAKRVYAKALSAARDTEQIELLAEKLGEHGIDIDLATHFGFLRSWHVVGPFDNTGRRGLLEAFGPEQGEIDLAATFEGKAGEVAWKEATSDDEYGAVDLNRLIVKEKEVVAYAFTTFAAAAARDVEFRIATVNAWRLWVNGELVGTRDEYHHGTQLDHYRVPARLREGANSVLLKVCQNEQQESYAETWQFQIRITDATGKAIAPATEDAPREATADESANPSPGPGVDAEETER